jgi:carbamoyl-phosphate synthase large subunit
MGIDSDFGRAYAKAQIQAGNSLPARGRVLVSVKESDRERVTDALRDLAAIGFALLATPGTAAHLAAAGLVVEAVAKVGQGNPDVVERIESGDVDLVMNTVGADPVSVRDSYSMRRAALHRGVPYFTTVAAIRAAVGGIQALRSGSIGVRSLQEIHGRA